MHAIAEGIVQGVCFRYYTSRNASREGVNGWVRNLPDGRRVEAVFEGPDEAVDRVTAWFRHGPPSARVDRCEMKEEPCRGEEGFVVRD